eukprot:COSAG06_NODE_17739_length_924_cov_0.990303_3_plen_65_part_00
MLSTTYRSIATWLTTLENHKYKHEHEASLIYKRFLFDMFAFWIQVTNNSPDKTIKPHPPDKTIN